MNKHQITLPDGVTVTRNSKAHTYAFAVVVSNTEESFATLAEFYGKTPEQFAAADSWGAGLVPGKWGVWGWRSDRKGAEAAQREASKAYPLTKIVPVETV